MPHLLREYVTQSPQFKVCRYSHIVHQSTSLSSFLMSNFSFGKLYVLIFKKGRRRKYDTPLEFNISKRSNSHPRRTQGRFQLLYKYYLTENLIWSVSGKILIIMILHLI